MRDEAEHIEDVLEDVERDDRVERAIREAREVVVEVGLDVIAAPAEEAGQRVQVRARDVDERQRRLGKRAVERDRQRAVTDRQLGDRRAVPARAEVRADRRQDRRVAARRTLRNA